MKRNGNCAIIIKDGILSFLNLCEEGPDKKFSILTYFDILLQNLLTSIFKYNCVSNKFSFVTYRSRAIAGRSRLVAAPLRF